MLSSALLHEFVKGHVCESADVPPGPEVWIPEPVLEGEPSEGFDDQLPLSEVARLVHTWQVAR